MRQNRLQLRFAASRARDMGRLKLFDDCQPAGSAWFCKAPPDQKAGYFGPGAKFGLLGSITTKEDCAAAGGQSYPHIFEWMVPVYPYEKNPRKVWSTDDDEHGHDNMDCAAMPGMKMP